MARNGLSWYNLCTYIDPALNDLMELHVMWLVLQVHVSQTTV